MFFFCTTTETARLHCLPAGSIDLVEGLLGEVVDSTASSLGRREAVRHDGALAAASLGGSTLVVEVVIGTTIVT